MEVYNASVISDDNSDKLKAEEALKELLDKYAELTKETNFDSKTCWNRLESTIPKRSIHAWVKDAVTPDDVAVVDLDALTDAGSLSAALKLSSPWYIGGENLSNLENYGIFNPDTESMSLTNLPVRRWVGKNKIKTGVVRNAAQNGYAGHFHGSNVDPRTFLAFHE
ncbi:hypothetical protein Pmar_PMAR024879 [Perkinsus marinus ATCC 50983]|uniref:Uncharacterized protein n=1 Tax=Perkinsus marinus (strain ATCC 50983 / TXsc) TaxID=423536 RepID=C5LCW3_PERM5|nr:hypothetical protein Pmar_PMAR024879 [Perkinsus marinus ATCC 50983]EER05416.1 hypothetical protein Pmar_PMAR024879 [Perkinsus marinus ATCC 50983]|eukprot:XP_002773600.1 hypothetical protein Pmar_PMAR024879 [Perkinsus marinus ATCC 50983]